MAEFQSGPNLKSKEIVQTRIERLAAVNERLLARGVIPELLVVTALHSDDGITSYIKSLNKLAPKVHAEVTVRNVPDEAVARRRIEQHNSVPGATMLMVPLPNRELEPEVLMANRREIEGITPGSRFVPSTPAGMIHMAEYGLGHRLVELPDPDRDVAVAGFGRSVGQPLVAMLGDMGIDAQVIFDATDPREYHMMRGRRVTFSGLGRPGELGAEQFGDPLGEYSRRFAVDAGVKRVDGALRGDIDSQSVAGLYDLMYTPPASAVGPMNAITMLERSTYLTAEMAGVLNEFDVAIHSMMGMRGIHVPVA